MKKLKTDKVYYVEWIDAGDVILRTQSGEKAMWITKATLECYVPSRMASIGLLAVEKKDYILLAGSYDLEKDEISAVQLIPKGCIMHIERLYIKSHFKDKEKKK